MLGLLIVYFLGRWVYNLAKKHKKPNSWLYAFLAVGTYYGVGILSVVIFMMLDVISSGGDIGSFQNRMIATLVAMPFGAGAVAILHYILKSSWSKEIKADEELLDESMDQLDKTV
jgi:hypothetical protein